MNLRILQLSLIVLIALLLPAEVLFSQSSRSSDAQAFTMGNGPVFAVPHPDSTSTRTVGSDVSMALRTVGHTLTSPTRWDGTDLAKVGVFGVGVVGSFLLDDEVRSWMLNNQSPFLDAVEPIGFNYGAPQFMGPVSIVVYGSGALFDNAWLRDTGLMMTESIIIIGIVQIPLRIITGRARPETGEGNNSWKFMGGTDQARASFFSGHSSIAFAVSTILARQIDNTFASIGLYALASLTPLARLNADRHWFSDVFIGTVLGIAVGNTVFNFHEESAGGTSSLSVLPTPNGVMISYRF